VQYREYARGVRLARKHDHQSWVRPDPATNGVTMIRL
jgi:hypothetical protein